MLVEINEEKIEVEEEEKQNEFIEEPDHDTSVVVEQVDSVIVYRNGTLFM